MLLSFTLSHTRGRERLTSEYTGRTDLKKERRQGWGGREGRDRVNHRRRDVNIKKETEGTKLRSWESEKGRQ